MTGNKKKKLASSLDIKGFQRVKNWQRGRLKASHHYRLLVKQSRQPLTGKWGRRHIPHFNWVRLHDSGNIILFQMLPAFFRCAPPWTCLMFWKWLVCHSINNVCCNRAFQRIQPKWDNLVFLYVCLYVCYFMFAVPVVSSAIILPILTCISLLYWCILFKRY